MNQKEMRLVKNGFIKFAICLICITSTVYSQSGINLELDIPEEYQIVTPGQEIWFTNKIFNLINQERIDVVLTYQLLDINQNILSEKKETVAIETQASFVENFNIPQEISPGDYILKAVLTSNNSNYETTRTIFVKREKIIENPLLQIVIPIIVLLILIVVFKRINKSVHKSTLKRKIHNIIVLKRKQE